MGVIKKAVKTVGKAVGKVVKGVAKGVKSLAKGVVKGVKKVVGGIGKVFGALGPIGTLAMSFIMPGVGSMLSGMWTTTANTLASGQLGSVLGAVGKGMQWVGNAASTISSGVSNTFNSITDKMKSAFTSAGNTVSEGAANMWNSAKEAVGMDPSKAASKDIGQVVAEGAQKTFKASGEFTQAGADAGFAVDLNKGLTPVASGPQPGFVGTDIYKQAEFGNVAPEVIQTAKDTGLNPFGEQARMLAEQNFGDPLANQGETLFDATGAKRPGAAIDPDMSFGQEGLDLTREAAAEANPTLRPKENKLFKNLLDAVQGMSPLDPTIPFIQSSGPGAMQGAGRGGVGGEGASGGQFLTDAQRMQQELLTRQLRELA